VSIPEGQDVTGFVMVEQVKSIDYRSRKARRIGKAPAQVLEEALAVARGLSDDLGEGFVLMDLGSALLLQGDRARARDCLTEGLGTFQPGGRSRFIAEVIERLADLAIAEQQPAHALRLLGFAGALREQLGTPLSPEDRSELDRLLNATRAQLPAPEWETAWAAGRALSFDEAVDLALNQPTPPDLAPTLPDPAAVLSPREIDVLRLIAEGRSNQEIGDTLFISPHTAATHVAHIMNKLGVDSRTAAAAWAIRQGIA
jgi:DNA-binding CsgD family transcriptional regulator